MVTKKEIKLVNQQHAECTLACVAMITGLPLDVVRVAAPEFRPNVGMSTSQTIEVLRQLGETPIQYIERCLIPGRKFIVSVPSLNTLGSAHMVVVDCRFGFITVYDPWQGIDGKLWYGDGGIDLTTWFEVVEIPELDEGEEGIG